MTIETAAAICLIRDICIGKRFKQIVVGMGTKPKGISHIEFGKEKAENLRWFLDRHYPDRKCYIDIDNCDHTIGKIAVLLEVKDIPIGDEL